MFKMASRIIKRSVDDLLKQLRKSARLHKQGWYHYTTMSSLIRMVDTGYANFTLISESNDGSEFLANRHYMMSFTYAKEESVALWGLYGVPKKEAVRLNFPYKKIMAWFNESEFEVYGLENGRRQSVEYLPKVSMFDVAYYSHNGLMLHKNKKIRLKDFEEKDITYDKLPLGPYVKKWPWSYEQEMRIVIEFEKPILNSKGKPYKKIAVNFSEPLEALINGEGCILLGPWCTRSSQTVKKKGLSTANINSSEFTGLLRLKTSCDMCKKKCIDRKCQQRKN
jgi:hypothetical protein